MLPYAAHSVWPNVLSALSIVLLLGCGAYAQVSSFLEQAEARLRSEHDVEQGKSDDLFRSFCDIAADPLAERVLFDYGAIFVTTEKVSVPRTCIFDSSQQVAAFQAGLDIEKHEIAGVTIELQREAMKQLLKASEEARQLRLSITPLDGSIAGGRNYDDTVRVWNSRVRRALGHWTRQGKIDEISALAAQMAPVRQQVERVMQWEKEGIFFSTNFSKSIFYAAAPPGTSQHLSLLAFDVVEAENPVVRGILNKHGWFQTIRTDRPHFTFLGLPESELPRRGLRNVVHEGNFYWIPSRNRPAAAPSAASIR